MAHKFNRIPQKNLVGGASAKLRNYALLDALLEHPLKAKTTNFVLYLHKIGGGEFLLKISMNPKNENWALIKESLLGKKRSQELANAHETAAKELFNAVLDCGGGVSLKTANKPIGAASGDLLWLTSVGSFNVPEELAPEPKSFELAHKDMKKLCPGRRQSLLDFAEESAAEEIDDVVFVDDALCEPEEKQEESDAERDKRESDRFLRAHASSLPPIKKQAPAAELDGELDLETLDMIEDAKREHAAKEKEQQRRIKALSTFECTMNFFGKPGVSVEAFASLLRELQDCVTDESVRDACALHARVQREAA